MKQGFWTVVKEIVKKADVVIEVLDARMPHLTRIRNIERYTFESNTPLILAINKADIVSDETVSKLKDEFHSENFVLISAKTGLHILDLVKRIKTTVKSKEIKVAIIGYPNTGKSSLINRFSKGGKARTSSESGFTRGLQLINGRSGFLLFDTPGVVPYADRDEVRLGLMSGISPHKLKNPDVVATELIKLFKDKNPKAFSSVFDVNMDVDPYDILEEVGEKKKLLIKGGEVDERRAAIMVLEFWHKGKLRL
ncbi:MAG: 50S ribosome-binding GTPase [Candidatus Woesearchaeota archaeon]|jgi:hypothetical protein|nr:50S ribosome-binding GTPase [Candidatus Woesearchaeota archaeon]MDP7180514.1 50S ribosome-binding GTPase [Candidatus Woesearchaeota archaeon]